MKPPPGFRLSTRCFREPTRLPARAYASGNLVTFGIGGLIAVFVAVSGGFGSHGIDLALRVGIICSAATGIIAAAIATRSLLASHRRLAPRPLLLGFLQVTLLTPATTVLCWAIAALFQGADAPPVWAFLWPSFLTILTAEVILQLLRRMNAGASTIPAPSSLSSRLPSPFRQADILAVEAEDHFLRIHTSAGDTLVPMRFADALILLRDESGAQTHRSWWVARSAVTSVKRGNGRARLSLINGLEVPASRQFARRLRDEGWY
jgi:hypothetical protein